MSTSTVLEHHQKVRSPSADRRRDPLNAARGLVIGCLLGMAVWMLLIAFLLS